MEVTASYCCDSIEECCPYSNITYTVKKGSHTVYSTTLPYDVEFRMPILDTCGTYSVTTTANNCCGTDSKVAYINVVDQPATLGITVETCCSCISPNQAVTFIPHINYTVPTLYVNDNLEPGRCINWKVYYETTNNLVYDYGQEQLGYDEGNVVPREFTYSFYGNGKYIVELIYVDYCECTSSVFTEIVVEAPITVKEVDCGKFKFITCPNNPIRTTPITLTVYNVLTSSLSTVEVFNMVNLLPIPTDGIYIVETVYNGIPYTFSIVSFCKIKNCYAKLIEFMLCADCEPVCTDFKWYYTQFVVLYTLLNELIAKLEITVSSSEDNLYIIDKINQTIEKLNTLCDGCMSL